MAERTAMDEWVHLFASRDELAHEYAELLKTREPSDGIWPVLNLAILDRWSSSGLAYVKRKAWALATGPSTGETAEHCSYCGTLDWTRPRYGRTLHKHACPSRTESSCQSHPEGCPSTEETA